MILKKLTATGFKSFADKTEFDFDRGITCIVGPNGCGKSNVVDAIKWVLGEQSAKSLRGKNMLDVIFNGSGTRKTSGMAQVDLTFDNADGTLPTDQTEVVITRRLYRSGESEYLMNKQPARLKDIRELFLDTGIGVDAYSVIEQGRVDLMLQANPQERRAIFEEAAGINKYKHQKKEALRRLERVNQNLQRVQDVVEELEKRLRSVKLAAGKARNYETYVGRLRELRSRHALSEYHRLRVSHDELSKAAAELHDRVTAIRTELSANEARTSEANVRIVDVEREIQEVESRLSAVQSQITAHQERIAASERRIADQQGLLDRSRERLSQFDEQVAVLDGRTQAQREAAAAIETELTTVAAEQRECQAEDTQCAHALNEKKVSLDEAKESIFELARRASQLNNEIQGHGIQRESLRGQHAKLEIRAGEIAQALEAAEQGHRERLDRRRQIDETIADRSRRIDETKSRIAEAAQQRAALIDQLAAAKEHRSGLESRRQLLAEMDGRHEGLLAGAREILERRDADATGQTFGYVRGAVGELFETDVQHARLVEAVLGNVETYLVAAERSRLVADLETLGESSGRVHAFCLDSIPPFIGAIDLSAQEGYVANMLDWVRVPEDCARLARHLLGRTHVVQSLDAAANMAKLDVTARFVTLDGVVWEPDGRLSVGALGSDTGLISRRSELRELTRELEEVAERIARMTDELQGRDSEVTHLEAMQQDLRTSLYEANTERVEVQAALNNLDNMLRQLNGERPHVLADIESLARRLTEIDAKEHDAKQALIVVDQRYLDAEQLSGQLQSHIDELSAKRQAIAERITAARVRVGELSQRRASVGEAIRELEALAIQLEADRQRASRDVVEAQERIEQSHRQIEEARQTLAALTEENGQLMQRSMSLRQERDSLREACDQFARDARRLRGELESVEAQLHEREIKLQEVRVRIEDLVARIAEELSVDLAVQYETYAPDEQEDWPAIEAEINELRQKIERLGNVNLDSIREQEELEQRLDFLTKQLEDLRSSEKQLTALIERLNKESEQRFIETFNAVSDHFSKLFKKLFGGGKAEVSLMDMNDVLECGIEITARPPGKEPRNISQLSGGEKTMTAIALLMAVFRSRPSPFVLLDEVDAALDEANNMRFAAVVKEFVELAQFIVITHSKRTMSIADVLYGVTMQEAGVSKRVSVRFDDERPTSAVA
ncbi:MAG TPA: chromosome segregation protein SMC [Phycisphaerae bacterium]|nr:chromosome segregation protein SMC [Phycisphaerae bacterium]